MSGSNINYEAVPGTVHLVDLDGHMNAKHKGNSKIVLIPTPSDDPDDPLNWTKQRKLLAMFCMIVYTFGVGVPSAAIYSVLVQISEATGITLGQLNSGTGYMFLFFGLGCMLFQPLALQYGKRPVYLLSVFATCFICVWSPYCKTNGAWIGSKILQGFFGSPIESLCEITVSDIYFEHERATGMSFYALALLTSNFLAPMLAGLIADGMDWKWVMFFCAIFAGVCFVFLFIFMEETNYTRHLNAKRMKITTLEGVVSNEKTGVTVTSEKLIEPILSHQSMGERMQETNENLYNEVDIISTDEEAPVMKSTKSWVQKMSLTSGIKKKFILPHYLWGPILMMRYPGVLWAGFLYGSSLVWFNLLNATASLIYSASPYNLSAANVGLTYASPTIFSVIFFLMCGYMTDQLKIRLAKRRNGLSYPEDRFWILIIYMVLGCLASIGWGVGAYYNQSVWLLIISMGVLGGCGIFACNIAATYVSDSYKELDTEGMVVVILIRNLLSFACSYGLTDWVTNLGYKHAFISSAFILLFCNGTFLIMRYTGPYWRNKTKKMYWKQVENNRRVVGQAH